MIFGTKAIGTVAYLGGLPAVLEQFTWSWGQMIQYNQEMFCNGPQHVHYMRSHFSDHAPARNHLVANFIGDWLVQMDTDHAFDPDIVARLVRTADECNVDVLSACYQMKQAPHVPVIFQWVQTREEPKEYGLQPMIKWDRSAKIIQIGSAGGGCLFVRRVVFDAIASKYREGAFDKIHPYSEDNSFFLRCRDLGIPAYAAMNIHSHHLRVVPVTLDDLHVDELAASDMFPVEGFK